MTNTAAAIAHPTVERIHVTPELAREWLQKNTRNRPLSKPYVRELKEDLLTGRWKETHQGVGFDTNGALVDGQHRLHAIAESGVPAWLPVTRGLDPSVFEVIDQVRKRTAAQILTMEGVSKDAPRYAAMARSILTITRKAPRVSNTEAVQYAVEHQATLSKYLGVARKFSAPVGAAFAWADILKWTGIEHAAERLMSLDWDDESFAGSDPMRALAKRAETFKSLGDGQAAAADKFAIAIGALSAINEGRAVRKARQSDQDYAAFERESQARASMATETAEAPVEAPAPPKPASEPPPPPRPGKPGRPGDVAIKVTGVSSPRMEDPHARADKANDDWEAERVRKAEEFAARIAGTRPK